MGRRAERATARFLGRRGLHLVARNYRTRGGEIDLVMMDGAEMVFVEVRFRSNIAYGDGAATVDHNKQHRLVRAAESFLLHRDSHNGPCRFDVVSVTRSGYRLRFEWIRNAFTL